jgi:hypothetical protein
MLPCNITAPHGEIHEWIDRIELQSALGTPPALGDFIRKVLRVSHHRCLKVDKRQSSVSARKAGIERNSTLEQTRDYVFTDYGKR